MAHYDAGRWGHPRHQQDLAGTATITDFVPSEGDVLDLPDFGFASFADFQATLVGLDYQGNPVGGPELTVKSTRIDLDGDTTMILQNIKPSELTAAQVIL